MYELEKEVVSNCLHLLLSTKFHHQNLDQASKHPKGQLGHPVNHEKEYGTKNDHFLKLCPGGKLGPPVNQEKCMGQKILSDMS